MLGSNIDPVENTRRALRMLAERVQLPAVSNCWETGSIGYDGPNFINAVVLIQTDLDQEELKRQVLGPIEQALGRVRSSNKNAPRTMDLDVILFDEQVVEPNLWRMAHIAAPLAELLPNLIDPETGQFLKQVAVDLVTGTHAIPRPELLQMTSPKDFESS